MKIKRLFSAVGLGLFAMAAAGAGVLAHAKKAPEAAHATEDKMITVVIDLGDAVGYEDFHKPEVHYYDASYGSIDKYADLHQLSGTYYTANLPYDSASENIDNIQFLFKQYSDDKWSNSIAINSGASKVYHFAFTGTWEGGTWIMSKDSWEGVPRMRGDDISDTNFTADVSSKTYKVSGLALNPGKTYQVFFGKWGFGAFRQASIDKYLDSESYSMNSFKVKEAGTYDVICHNEYSDGGIFEIKKHQNITDAYIYYVLENDTPTNDCIYSWGCAEQFGAWTGTKVTEVTGVKEVHGVFNFEGSGTKLIYKIPVKITYPTGEGDTSFKWNNGITGEGSWESEEFELVNGAAYWYTGTPNLDAGKAIDFLVRAEDVRNAVSSTSVCNISKEDATTLVNAYNGLSEGVRSFIDKTTTYTWTSKDKTEQGMISYKKIVQQLGEIAGVAVAGSNMTFGRSDANFDSQAIIIIASIVVASMIGLTVLHFVRRRAHN